MAWSDWDLSRCVEDTRSLRFPGRSSNENNKLGLELQGSCLYAGKPGSPHTPGICRVLTVGMSCVPWAAGGYCGLRPRYPHSSAVLPTFREEILPIKPFYYRFVFTNAEPRGEKNEAFNLKECNGILSCPLNYSATSILNVWFISSKMIHTLLINHLYFSTNMPQVVQHPEYLDWNYCIFWSSGPEPGGSFWRIWDVCVLRRWGMGCLVDGRSGSVLSGSTPVSGCLSACQLSGAANFSFAADHEDNTEASKNFFSFSFKTLKVTLS